MGQLTSPSLPGWTILSIDRDYAPGAGPGASGNQVVMIGLNAGKNSTIANAVIIGNQSGGATGAGITDLNLNGTTVVGAQSLGALTAFEANAVPITVLGQGNLNLLTKGDSTVAIGSGILSAYTGTGAGLTTSVFIGNKLMQTATGTAGATNDTVMIGYNIMPNASGISGANNSIFIGNTQFTSLAANSALSNMICLGAGVGPSVTTSCSGNILIGSAADTSSQGTNNINIGASAKQLGVGTGNETKNILIGISTQSSGNQNVVIGDHAVGPANNVLGACVGNVVIGANAGITLSATAGSILLIESATVAGPTGALIYGDFATNNLVLGNSVQGTNRDLISGGTATNIVKLLNGTIGGANPVGGGYFYVVAGVLRWVDSAGTNTQLSMTAAGQLAGNAITAYTNNAAGNAGTLTNAPAIGNPTKWIPINDAGTIRNIPAW